MNIDSTKDLYKILGISDDADQKTIKKAYRKLARKYHPDSSRCDDSNNFLEIQAAYETLGDSKKREKYDAELHQQKTNPTKTDYPPLTTFYSPHIINERHLFEMFDNIFTYDTYAGHEKLELELFLTPEEARYGYQIPIPISINQSCHACGGTGGTFIFPCHRCSGRGSYLTERQLIITMASGVSNYTTLEVSLSQIGFPHEKLKLLIRIQFND